ncbi:MAG TPA: hypothetical protein VK469_16545 [Candidatus Kapabacteria bacterium]|nr:hypothetical protein [Candidatus Kapabacteria bacterium]
MNNLPQVNDALELMTPMSIEREISTGFESVPVECSPTGTITCSMGKA